MLDNIFIGNFSHHSFPRKKSFYIRNYHLEEKIIEISKKKLQS